MRKAIYYTHHYAVTLPPGHRFPMEKYRLLYEALLREQLVEPDELLPAPLAERETILLVHTPAYVDAFLNGTLPRQMERRIGIPWSPAFVKRTLASVGATVEAAKTAVVTGFAAALSGGTHHAFSDYGEGFCVFNDLAIAAQYLLHHRYANSIAIVDFDVHQGNGTAAIFANNDAVFTASIHCKENFPFRKVRSSLDIALDVGTTDEEYLPWVDVVLEAVERFSPDVLFYQAGVDVLREDRLGKFALTHAGIFERDLRVFQFAQEHNIPCVLTLGGGYSKPLDATIEGYLQTYRALCAVYSSRSFCEE